MACWAPAGMVACSSSSSQRIAYARLSPHISSDACSPEQHAGRSGWPKIAQRKSSISCTQGIPAGLPLGMPGIALLIEGAMQQAAQRGRQSGDFVMAVFYRTAGARLLKVMGEAKGGAVLYLHARI
jgi:hypothetical protein